MPHDEAHEVRKNRIGKSKSLAAVEVKIVRAVTGTPIVNRFGNPRLSEGVRGCPRFCRGFAVLFSSAVDLHASVVVAVAGVVAAVADA